MQSTKQIFIVNEIRRLQKEVVDLRAQRKTVLMGAQSASMSGGAGSKSYTNWQPSQFDEEISRCLREIRELKRELSGNKYLWHMVSFGRC